MNWNEQKIKEIESCNNCILPINGIKRGSICSLHFADVACLWCMTMSVGYIKEDKNKNYSSIQWE